MTLHKPPRLYPGAWSYRGHPLNDAHDVIALLLSPYSEFVWLAILTWVYMCWVGPYFFPKSETADEIGGREEGEIHSTFVAKDITDEPPLELTAAQAKVLECPICLEPMNKSILLPCGHTGCRACLEEAFLCNPCCPSCRADMPLKVVHDLQLNSPINELIAQVYPALTKERAEEFNVPCDEARGTFKNIEPFFGQGRVELLYIEPKTTGSGSGSGSGSHTGGWQARKLVGDRNVPRGELSWVTQGMPVSHILRGRPVVASVQIRKDISDPQGFSWMQGLQVKYSQTEDTWSVGGTHGNGNDRGRGRRLFKFVRVGAEEAEEMQRARSGEDWA